MRILAIYDDTGRKSEVIADIIGDKGFADVVVKRRRLEDYYKEYVQSVYENVEWRKISSVFEYQDVEKEMERISNDVRVVHCFSNYLVSDKELAKLSFEKLQFIDAPYCMMDEARVVAMMFPNKETYRGFLQTIINGVKPWDAAHGIKDNFQVKGLVDIGNIGNFIQCITGNFDARYFNSLKGNEYTIVKSSTNKKKIKAEYTFYHLLPEDMKYWFVIPFDYKEEEDRASYTMERLHMTDLAIKWVHGSMDEMEFEALMDKYFYFFTRRHSKVCKVEEYAEVSKKLYVDKVVERIADLKQLPEYAKIERLLSISQEYEIDTLVEKYFSLKEKIEKRQKFEPIQVIGHGDPCFANSMYNKSTKTLKFIDPKGALKDEDLWTNPYYDIAKLSHSVCGCYDFFNNALFDIHIDNTFGYDLEIPFDNSKYVEIFKRKAEENGFDYLTVRIYEASLFLSMLPLHIDNPHKVFGFVLNVKRILEEIERDV